MNMLRASSLRIGLYLKQFGRYCEPAFSRYYELACSGRVSLVLCGTRPTCLCFCSDVLRYPKAVMRGSDLNQEELTQFQDGIEVTS